MLPSWLKNDYRRHFTTLLDAVVKMTTWSFGEEKKNIQMGLRSIVSRKIYLAS